MASKTRRPGSGRKKCEHRIAQACSFLGRALFCQAEWFGPAILVIAACRDRGQLLSIALLLYKYPESLRHRRGIRTWLLLWKPRANLIIICKYFQSESPSTLSPLIFDSWFNLLLLIALWLSFFLRRYIRENIIVFFIVVWFTKFNAFPMDINTNIKKGLKLS